MPDIYGPFDPALDVNGDPIPGTGVWAQDQWYQFAPTWAPSGVVGSPQSSASAGPLGLTVSGRDISVALGRAWVYGAGYERTSTPWTYSVPANTNSDPRRDRLVLRRDLAAKTVLPTFLEGTPAATPVAPTILQEDTGKSDLTLFSWTTPGSSGAPLTGLVDERVWTSTPSAGQTAKSYLSTAFTTSSTAAVDVPGWQVSLTSGLWRIDLDGNAASANGAFLFLAPASGLVAATGPSVATTGAVAGQSGRFAGYRYSESSTDLYPINGLWDASTGTTGLVVVTETTANFRPFAIFGHLQVTTGGILKVRAASQAGAASIDAFSTLSATRLGS